MPHPDRLRRALLRGLATGLLAPLAVRAARQGDATEDALAALKRRAGGRLGVCVHDAGDGASLAWRGSERFALCSTFKLLLAAVSHTST